LQGIACEKACLWLRGFPLLFFILVPLPFQEFPDRGPSKESPFPFHCNIHHTTPCIVLSINGKFRTGLFPCPFLSRTLFPTMPLRPLSLLPVRFDSCESPFSAFLFLIVGKPFPPSWVTYNSSVPPSPTSPQSFPFFPPLTATRGLLELSPSCLASFNSRQNTSTWSSWLKMSFLFSALSHSGLYFGPDSQCNTAVACIPKDLLEVTIRASLPVVIPLFLPSFRYTFFVGLRLSRPTFRASS